MRSYIRSALLILILLFLVTFGLKNSRPISLAYYFGLTTTAMPLYVLLYIAFFIGILIGIVAGFFRRRSLQKSVKALQRENRELKGQPGAPAVPAESSPAE
jgi:uncharacterized integral membrane protein